MANAPTNVKSDFRPSSTSQFGSELKNKGQDVVDRAKDAATNLADKARDVAGNAADKAKDIASNVADKARDAAATMGARASDAASYVSDKAEGATSAVGGGMKSLAGSIRESGPHSGMMGSASSAVADTLESGGRYLQEHGLKGIGEDVTNLIRRNPIPALLVGVGIGYLLARATSSRS